MLVGPEKPLALLYLACANSRSCNLRSWCEQLMLLPKWLHYCSRIYYTNMAAALVKTHTRHLHPSSFSATPDQTHPPTPLCISDEVLPHLKLSFSPRQAPARPTIHWTTFVPDCEHGCRLHSSLFSVTWDRRREIIQHDVSAAAIYVPSTVYSFLYLILHLFLQLN